MNENSNDLFEVAPVIISPRITVMVGYSWEKDGDNRLVPPRHDSRWQAIKAKIQAEANAVETCASNRKSAAHKVEISIERLRGTHGDMLLGNLLARIRKADILIFDIGLSTGECYNFNVLEEVGMALMLDRQNQGRLFVLKPQKLREPSDLSGFLFTEYVSDNKEFKITDDSGFRAALRSSLMEFARRRGMIGGAKKNTIEVEFEETNQDEFGKPRVKQARVSRKRKR